MQPKYSRRAMLTRSGCALAGSALGLSLGWGCVARRKASIREGAVVGQTLGAAAGQRVLAEGGNAIDAVVTAALVSCIAAPYSCGPGGYGGHLTVRLGSDQSVRCIDFNSTAPAAARADMFPPQTVDSLNRWGWLAAGVPGTLAGLDLALRRYGTWSFHDAVQPAIALAKAGVVVSPVLAACFQRGLPRFQKDPGSVRLFLPGGKVPKAGERFRNPELAEMLSILAERGSVESFYRGDIAQLIATGFHKHGGLVTAKDLAEYHACEVEPLHLTIGDCEVYTAPLTAGGLTALEALHALQALRWGEQPLSPAATHARLETLRLAWKDRLELLGDPEKVAVPVARLLSAEHSQELAAKARAAAQTRRPIELQLPPAWEPGTVNLCSADRHGNLIAVTLTHGGSFGAQVTVEGLGLTLGHGMWRFNPYPPHPNAPGPGKRPLHNMCPSFIRRGDHTLLALGGAGGVRIPNAIFDFMTHYVLRGKSLAAAMAAPRCHCTGTRQVTLENSWPNADRQYLRQIGFDVQTGPSATVGAVEFDSQAGAIRSAWR
jgi:gamma-glutamyltranspeptidase / glutathione hydrolase